jgi:hypothetical protein
MARRELNRRALESPRDHLVHVIPDLLVTGCYSFATTLAQDTNKNYAHTLLFDSALPDVDDRMLLYAHACGMQVLHADRITPELLDGNTFTGAILYNVTDRDGIGAVVPSVYYSNGEYDPAVESDVVIAASEFAAKTDRAGNPIDVEVECIVPPFIQTRSVRRIKGPKHPFTVGMVSSGDRAKYPSKLVIHMLQHVPNDIGLMVTKMDSYAHPGVELAMAARRERTPKGFLQLPVIPSMALRYLIGVDVCLFGPPPSYHEPYGRTIVEAMALGKVVICDRRCGPMEYLEHGVNCLLYDHPDEALEHILRIRKDEKARQMLGANAQMWASWQDASVHIGKLKRVLRMIGT